MLDANDMLIGNSPWVRSMRSEILQVAGYGSNVLITGQTGTGKELIAQGIHRNSQRRACPFIVVDCAAVSDTLFASHIFGHVKGAFTGADHDSLGCFRAAHGGTVFLDEIGELDLEFQSKLLRVLQERTIVPIGTYEEILVDVRVIAATNRNLAQAVASGRFRSDLYHRLKVIELQTLTLRDRREDIEPLARHLFARFARSEGLEVHEPAPRCLEHMLSLDWPGNVRELANFVERVVILGHDKAANAHTQYVETHEIEDLANLSARQFEYERSLKEANSPSNRMTTANEPATSVDWPTLDAVEREHLLKTLEHTSYNISRAAKLLEIGRQQLARKMAKYGLTTTPALRGRPRRDTTK